MGSRKAQLHDAKELGALGRSTALLPSQPALPHGGLTPSAAGSRDGPTATNGTAVLSKAVPEQSKPAPLQLPGYPAGPSAASSPVTPPASDVPLSASDSPASPPHTASKQPAQQQHLAGQTAPAATMSAAAVALSTTKHRLDGSLLLQQLMPLAASLGVAVGAGDLSRMHSVLTLLQSVPMTGQLLFASQVALPVRSILQQQVQLQAQHRGQKQELQLLDDVVAAAKQLLRRWRGLLKAEVDACDEYRMARAQQCARTQRKQRQRSKGAAADDTTAQAEQARQVTRAVLPSAQHTAAAPQHKRTFSQYQREQQMSQEQQLLALPNTGRPGKQQKCSSGNITTPMDQQHLHQQQARTGVPLLPPLPPGAAAAAACSGGLSRRSNSRYTLDAIAGSSVEDLPDLAGLGMDWEPTLPYGCRSSPFGAEAAAAADAALEGGGLACGVGMGAGPWAGEGEETGSLLVEGKGGMGMQGIPGALLL